MGIQVSPPLSIPFHKRVVPTRYRASIDERARLAVNLLREKKLEAIPCVRSFLKGLPKGSNSAAIESLKTAYLAVKLGIKPDVLYTNHDFKEFVAKHHLDQYLKNYGDRVHVRDGAIYLVQNGREVAWDELKANLPKPLHKVPSQPWIWGPDGLQDKDLYTFETLCPFKHIKNHPWGNRYIFEFCSIAATTFRMSGDHAWFRLKTPDGSIYSVGKYRPGKQSFSDNFQFPLKMKRGYLQSPDVSEFWPEEIHTLEMEITKEDFERIKLSVEEDKKNEENITFQTIGDNCTQYVTSKLHLANIQLPTKTVAIRALLPYRVQKIGARIGSKLPGVVQRVAKYALALFSNVLQVVLGAWIKDKNVSNLTKKTHFNSWKDLFSFQKGCMESPSYAAHFVFPAVKAWRRENLMERAYQIPRE